MVKKTYWFLWVAQFGMLLIKALSGGSKRLSKFYHKSRVSVSILSLCLWRSSKERRRSIRDNCANRGKKISLFSCILNLKEEGKTRRFSEEKKISIIPFTIFTKSLYISLYLSASLVYNTYPALQSQILYLQSLSPSPVQSWHCPYLMDETPNISPASGAKAPNSLDGDGGGFTCVLMAAIIKSWLPGRGQRFVMAHGFFYLLNIINWPGWKERKGREYLPFKVWPWSGSSFDFFLITCAQVCISCCGEKLFLNCPMKIPDYLWTVLCIGRSKAFPIFRLWDFCAIWF